jgi:type II secretory pathway component GspD/PulD (secretin)
MRTCTPPLNAIFALLLVASSVSMPAQQPPPAGAPAPAAAAGGADAAALADRPAATAESAGTAAVNRSQSPGGQDVMAVDFSDGDIRSILTTVADLFELNLAMPDTLQGKTTIKLKDVTWRQIFTTVLTPVNYTFIEDGNIIKIVSNDSLTAEPVTTDVFLINYAKATDILPTITSLVDPAAGGKIVVDARSNALVITERPSRMNKIRPIIEKLDRATDQVMIEAKFVEVTNSDVKNLGVNWSSLANYQIGAGNLGQTFNRDRTQAGNNGSTLTNGTTTTDQRGTTATTNNTQNSGSTNTNTVNSANGAATSNATTSMTGGLNSTSVTGTNNALTTTATNAMDFVSGLTNNDTTSRALTAVFSATDFNIVLSALQSLQTTKIISNPTIVTLNNTPAEIKVGQERPIPSYTYNTERGVYEVSGFTYKAIGIILRVTPQVNSQGFIKLTVDPEVSQSNRDANFQGASIPIVESRTAKTQVSLRDGYTMGIGGLLQTSTSNSGNKVPLLGNLPVLGRLFRSENKNLESTNLIIFITAKTISAEGAPVEQVFESERVRELRMKREDLPGHRDGTNPFVPVAPPAAAGTNSNAPDKPFFRLNNTAARK